MALVDDAKWWTSTRQQWGQPVGKHQAVAKMICGLHGAAVRDEGDGVRRLRVRRPQERRHPPRGGGRQVLVLRDAVEDVRRLPAGARRARLRERQVAVRARRAPDGGRDGPARRAHQPHLRGLVAGHAPDHGARGARHALQAGDADPAAEARPEGVEARGDDEGGRLLRHVAAEAVPARHGRAPRGEAPERAQPQAPRLCGEDRRSCWRGACSRPWPSTVRSSRRSRSSSATSSTSASTCS